MANTDEVPYQPVWVTFDPEFCGAVLARETKAQIDPTIWDTYGEGHFREDKWPSEFEGVTTDPTFDWVGTITGRRRSDLTCFYAILRVKKADISPPERQKQIWIAKYGDKFDLTKFSLKVAEAIDYFNSFSDCDCKVGVPCEYHARLEFTGEPVEAGEAT